MAAISSGGDADVFMAWLPLGKVIMNCRGLSRHPELNGEQLEKAVQGNFSSICLKKAVENIFQPASFHMLFR